jgi:ubiquinone/menaquinone biosynthesis C-methylase UbiE
MAGYFNKARDLEEAKLRMVRAYVRFPKASPQYKFFIKYISAESVNIKILDVGAGEGMFLKAAKILRPHAQLFAIDVENNLNNKIIDDPIEFRQCDLNVSKIPYQDNSFDYVNCAHVLEHLLNPIGVLDEIQRVLKPGGILYLEAPDVRWASLPRLPFFNSDDGTYNFWDDPTHIRPYSRPALKKALEMAGFQPLKTFRARKWLHLGALPMAVFSRKNDYKVAVLQALLGLWCGALGKK